MDFYTRRLKERRQKKSAVVAAAAISFICTTLTNATPVLVMLDGHVQNALPGQPLSVQLRIDTSQPLFGYW